jgi:hypothetical protein
MIDRPASTSRRQIRALLARSLPSDSAKVRLSRILVPALVLLGSTPFARASRRDHVARLAIRPHVRDPGLNPGQPVPTPHVVAEIADAPRGVARSAVLRVLNALERPLLDCYARTIATTPNASGMVLVRVTIARTGSVSDAEVASDYVHDGALGSCVVARMLQSTFAPMRARTNLTLRFLFSQQ